MAEKISEIFLKTMFEYTGYGCNYVMDIENMAPGEEPKATIKVCSDPGRQLLFSYASRDGLNLTGRAGGVIEKNILGKLLALPKNDIEKMMEFFKQYGFLLPLSKDEYSSIGAEDLLTVVNRIKTTVRLYNSINKKDYKGVLLAAAFLLYSPVVSMNTPEDKFSTCEHAFGSLIRTYVKPRIGENKFGGQCITYEGVSGTKKWERLDSYGPKFAENIVQASTENASPKPLRQFRIQRWQPEGAGAGRAHQWRRPTPPKTSHGLTRR